jgi:cell pole-organizing protein PopZ
MNTVKAKTLEQDMSMEEILASIRRIIAEDQESSDAANPPETDSAAATATQPEPPVSRPEAYAYEQEEDSSAYFAEEEAVSNTSAPEVKAAEYVPAPEAPRVVQPLPATQPVRPPVVDAVPVQKKPENPPVRVSVEPSGGKEAVSPASSSSLLSSQTDKAVLASFSKLSQVAGAPSQSAPVTMDEFVRQMLRPMLKDWLDKNLPRIVERLVQAEIERALRSYTDPDA